MGKGKGGGKSNKLFKISPDMCGFLVTTERNGREIPTFKKFFEFLYINYVCVCGFMLNNPDIFINLLNFCKIVEKFKFLERFFNRKLYSRER